MDRGTRNVFAAAIIGIVALTLGATLLLGGSPLTGNPSRTQAPPPGAISIDGVVVGVQSLALDQVTGFSVRTIDDGTIDFVLGELDDGTQFPPGHLVEHQAGAIPVRIWFRTVDGENLAVRLEDAPSP